MRDVSETKRYYLSHEASHIGGFFVYLHKHQLLSMPRFINPFSDWGFKKIFGQEINKDLLIKFLNDLLDGEHHITDLVFKDKEQQPEAADMRGIIYDIYCSTDKGEHIIVEMQNRYQPFFTDRSIYYASRDIVNQGVKGTVGDTHIKWDYRLAPVYTVCLLNYDVGAHTPTKFRTDIALMDMEDKTVFSDRLRFIYLMLPLFSKNEEDECENDFERWIYILKNMSTFERMPFQARNAVFKKLSEITDIAALSKDEREKYDESLKVLRDYHATLEGAVMLGEEKGLAKGRAEGMMQRQLDIAKMMLEDGEPMAKIMRYTGLTDEEIEKLK